MPGWWRCWGLRCGWCDPSESTSCEKIVVVRSVVSSCRGGDGSSGEPTPTRTRTMTTTLDDGPHHSILFFLFHVTSSKRLDSNRLPTSLYNLVVSWIVLLRRSYSYYGISKCCFPFLSCPFPFLSLFELGCFLYYYFEFQKNTVIPWMKLSLPEKHSKIGRPRMAGAQRHEEAGNRSVLKRLKRCALNSFSSLKSLTFQHYSTPISKLSYHTIVV